MFFWIRSQTASTGTVERRFPFHCSLCGAATEAMVHSQGFGQSVAPFGIGASAERARGSATMNADFSAQSAIDHVLCLQCGALQPRTAQKYEVIEALDEAKSKRRLKLAAGAAIVVGLIGAYPAINDLRESMALPIAVGAAALSMFAFVYAVVGWPTGRPLKSVSRVWLWWTQPDGTPGWVPAPTFFPPSRSDLSAASPKYVFGGVVASLAAVIAGAIWFSSFEPVYVVEAAKLGASSIRIDGKEVAKGDMSSFGYKDAVVDMERVRKGKDHHIELLAADGSIKFEAVLPAADTDGWVVAPGAVADGLCFGESEVIYGDTSGTPRGGPLGRGKAWFALEKTYQDEFREPPSTVEVKQGQTVHRWGLRAYPCDSR